MQSVGALVRRLREEHGWSQRVLAERTGFSREYVAGVEWAGKASVNFLKACEQVFELQAGSLVKWPAYAAALLWCRRNKLRITDYLEMVRQADAGFRPAPAGPGGSGPGAELDEAEDLGTLADAPKAPVRGRFSGRTRRIMSRIADRIRLELVAFFCDVKVVWLRT